MRCLIYGNLLEERELIIKVLEGFKKVQVVQGSREWRNTRRGFYVNLWYRGKYQRKEVDLYAASLSRKLVSVILVFDAPLYATDLRYLIFRSESKSFRAAICIASVTRDDL